MRIEKRVVGLVERTPISTYDNLEIRETGRKRLKGTRPPIILKVDKQASKV
jgi:hypothetical protein